MAKTGSVEAGVLAASLTFSSLTYAQGEPIKLGELKTTSQQDLSQKDPQSGGKSVISGKVFDLNEAVVVGTKVTLRNNNNGEIRVTKSDGEGHYEFKHLEPGIFGIRSVCPWVRYFYFEGY